MARSDNAGQNKTGVLHKGLKLSLRWCCWRTMSYDIG
jgi:hypothetical protein